MGSGLIRTAVRVEGIVQGVGFRPFVYTLATGLGLVGLVGNDPDGVFVEVEGPIAAVSEFLLLLERDAPPLARIERVTTRAITPRRSASFAIAASEPAGTAAAGGTRPARRRRTLVSADTATCADCLRELIDPADRRFGYPFINCTNCGPRFTIVRDVPYDRPMTTMAAFAMCEPCAAEYHDPGDRRFHAQPTCCPACGPRLTLRDPAGNVRRGRAAGGGRRTAQAGPGPRREGAGRLSPGRRRHLRGGRRAAAGPQAPRGQAVRGHGRGPGRGAAPGRGRHRGRRPADQPGPADRAAAAPAAGGAGGGVAAATAPGNRQLGIMLPYTPLHHLLLAALGRDPSRWC